MNTPNLISLGRLLAVPVNVWLILLGEWRVAFLLFLAAGVSDALDGMIAKRFGLQTRLGRYLDPLADKVLLVSVFVVLAVQGQMPVWLVGLVVARDVLIVAGAILLHFMRYTAAPCPRWASKVNTAVQIAAAALVLSNLAYDFGLAASFLFGVFAVTALTTVASGIDYLIDWGQRVAALQRAGP